MYIQAVFLEVCIIYAFLQVWPGRLNECKNNPKRSNPVIFKNQHIVWKKKKKNTSRREHGRKQTLLPSFQTFHFMENTGCHFFARFDFLFIVLHGRPMSSEWLEEVAKERRCRMWCFFFLLFVLVHAFTPYLSPSRSRCLGLAWAVTNELASMEK